MPRKDFEEEDYEPQYDDVAEGKKRRRRSEFINDVAAEEEEDDDDEEGGGDGRRRKKSASLFIDDEAQVDEDEEDEDEDDGDYDFIAKESHELPGKGSGRGMQYRHVLPMEDDDEDIREAERIIRAKYLDISEEECEEEEQTDVGRHALLPSVHDPKLWMVKCAIGRERETAVCLMQKALDKGNELLIRSAIAIDNLKNYIYVEADKEAHMREACKGLRVMYASSKITLVPIKEMTDVLSVESKSMDLSRDAWVRMKIGIYKGDLAKVVDVDNVRKKVKVKLIPRIDLVALANKLEGKEVAKRKGFNPPQRFMNVEEARELNLRVEIRRDPRSGDYFENINGMMFKDGFLYKLVSIKSISTQNIHPSFDELEKFRPPSENGDGDISAMSTLFVNRKKGHFMKGDKVIIVKGDLKNLKGWVEKVEDGNVHIRPDAEGLPKTLAVNEKELSKFFNPGNHVKIVSGESAGATGMVIKIEQHFVIILSDTTKEHLRVFSDNVVESSEVKTQVLLGLGTMSFMIFEKTFGVIIRVETEGFQVLKGIPDRPEVVLVKLREIKRKVLDRRNTAQDRSKNPVAVKDVVRILDGPCKGQQGAVEHVHRGLLFIYDRHHLEHAGFICVKSHSCMVVGETRANGDRKSGYLATRFTHLNTPSHGFQSPGRLPGGPPLANVGRYNRGGREGHDSSIGTTIRIRQGPLKGYRGRVVAVKGSSVRVELESQMKVVTVDRHHISDTVVVATPHCDVARYGAGSETPVHPSRTPLHPYMTPVRDSGATPIHDGMRTPMKDRAWNLYMPMSPLSWVLLYTDFIAKESHELPGEDSGRGMQYRHVLPMEDDDEDIREAERIIRAKYLDISEEECDEEEQTDVGRQALLPFVHDPKLWMVKCAIGRERETAVCLMQKALDKGNELQIRSAIAIDNLKNYIYVEADREAHVREACKGLRVIYASSKITLVPIKEMTDVLSVESKSMDLSRDAWVRMKIGIYKGDLAKVVDVDNVRKKVKVKLIPRIDLVALANKLEGKEVAKRKGFNPPQRFMNVEEARELNLRVEIRRDPRSGDYFENINGMIFKDGFLYKLVSIKSISTQNMHPSFDELEKFRPPSENGDGDISAMSTLFANRKKGHFMKGDKVIIVKGDLKNLKGWVEKVEDGNVHIRPDAEGLPKTLAVNEKELSKFFNPGNHVKIVSGESAGATGMVIKIEQHFVIILSDTTKEHLRIFSDNVVESHEVKTGVTRIGDYELHDLVMVDEKTFGVIIRVETEGFQVLKGIPDRPEVVLVKLREIKRKVLDRRNTAQDRSKNPVAVKDVVRILDGPCKGQQGAVEHVHRGLLFIYDRHYLEHAGFICVKSHSCMVVGETRANGDRKSGYLATRFTHLNTPSHGFQSPGRLPGGPPLANVGRYNRGGREGHDSSIGTTIRIRQGPLKGYRGRVVALKGSSVRVELESQMKVVTVDQHHISDTVVVVTPHCDVARYGAGSETPVHPSRTPLHPYMTPVRDSGATPIHDGMRTPMKDRAWNLYMPMSPLRDNWEDANPASWGTSPQYQPSSPNVRAFEAPTPDSGWANTPSGYYTEAGAPGDATHAYGNAPSPALPSTPGGQPMTPGGGGGLDMMSPAIAGGDEGIWLLPDILVTVHRPGEDSSMVLCKNFSRMLLVR